MNIHRRIAAAAGGAAFATFAAIAAPASGATTPPVDHGRPCFIIQSHWSTAFDGPPPTCSTPSWQVRSPSPAWARFRG